MTLKCGVLILRCLSNSHINSEFYRAKIFRVESFSPRYDWIIPLINSLTIIRTWRKLLLVIKSRRRTRDVAITNNERIGLQYIIVWNNVATTTNFGRSYLSTLQFRFLDTVRRMLSHTLGRTR